MFCLAQCDGGTKIVGNDPADGEVVSTPTPRIVTGKKKKMDKDTLAKRVAPIEENAAQIIKAEDSELKEAGAPFLRDGKIYRVEKFAPTRMIVIYVGTVGESFTALIGGRPEKYLEFVERSGVRLDDDELRKAYVLNFLEVTKSQDERLRVLDSVADVKPRPNLNDLQKEEFERFREKYESVIKPVRQNEAGAYEVFVIKGQDLVRMDLTIGADGAIKKQETVLESNILIPYAL